MGLRVLFSRLSLSVDAHCQDDVFEFSKPHLSFPREGRAIAVGGVGPSPSMKGEAIQMNHSIN